MEDCRPESAYRALASTLTEFSGRADWSLSAKPSYPRHTLGCRHNINPCRLSRATTSHRSDLIGASAGQVANLNRIFTPRGCPAQAPIGRVCVCERTLTAPTHHSSRCPDALLRLCSPWHT